MNQLPQALQRVYERLTTPVKIQDYLNTLPANFETKGETCMSPLRVAETGTAHCMEGAMFAASALRFHGFPPLVMDLRAKRPDQDHVVALFKLGGYWGAISKTNHAVLRYREPVYKTLRELALSFFHEYFENTNGKKNLREYSLPVNLSRFDSLEWETSLEDLWDIPVAVDEARHYLLFSKSQEKFLRPAEPIEIAAGKILEWTKSGKRLV